MTRQEAFIQLTHREIQVLSKTQNGGAMATYMAIKSFVWHNKSSAYPTRKTLRKRMGDAYSLRSITEAIKTLVAVKLLERIYDERTAVWFFRIIKKVCTKKTQGRKNSKGSRKLAGASKIPGSPSKEEYHSEEKKKILQKERIHEWCQSVQKTKDQMDFWKSSKFAMELITKGMTPPTLSLPNKQPSWLSMRDLEDYLKELDYKKPASTWIWKWFSKKFYSENHIDIESQPDGLSCNFNA